MREDYIQSAVQFLNEPQVAAASVTKKVEFLESKGLSAEEIEETLRRVAAEHADGASASSSGPVRTPGSPAQYVPPRPSYMQQQPPPIPERDWKDYFVMATVSVGVAYGMYEVARRYVLPMILPPTPASLEADKEALDEEFGRMEALLKQVQEDQAESKRLEESRAAEFAEVMHEAREVIESIKQHAEERKQESKLALSNVESLRELVPRAIKQHGDIQKQAVTELENELKSLKQLISRRQNTGPQMSIPPASAVPSSLPGFQRKPRDPASAAPSASAAPAKPAAAQDDAPFIPDPKAAAAAAAPASSPANGASESDSKPAEGDTASAPATKLNNGIPAWQLAAQKTE